MYVSGNSKTMHCGILISMSFWAIPKLLKSDTSAQKSLPSYAFDVECSNCAYEQSGIVEKTTLYLTLPIGHIPQCIILGIPDTLSQ